MNCWRTGALAILLCCSCTVNAGLLQPITVNGSEWLQPIDFVNLSWSEIAAVCDPATGACDGTLNGNDMSSWTWANREDIAALFNFYIGAEVHNSDTDRHLGFGFGEAFFADGWLPTGSFIAGSKETSGFTAGKPGQGALMGLGLGISDSYSNYTFPAVTPPPPEAAFVPGGWFKRSAVAVSAPASIFLMGIALAFLGARRYGGRQV